MTLRSLADLSAADWFLGKAASPLLGPAGYAAYARILHGFWSPDEDERAEGHLRDDLLEALCDVLTRHTDTPEDCFFALWDGYGDIQGGEPVSFLTSFTGSPVWPGRIFRASKPAPPPPAAFPAAVMNGPRLDANHADHLLFAGPLAEAGRWGATGYGPGVPRDINSPNLMWPADHLWFVTTNIDSTWTGVGGSAALIHELLADDRLEVVSTRYDNEATKQ
jgi:hypothetical protein